MERSFYPNKGYTSVDPRPETDFDPVMVKAYQAIRNHQSTTANPVVIESHAGAGFSEDELIYLETQLKSVVEKWSDHFAPNSKVLATFVTEKDTSVMMVENTSNYDDLMDVAKLYNDKSKSGWLNCGWKNGISGAHTIWQGPNAGSIGFAIVFPSAHNGTYWLPKNLPHELTHGLQDLIWFKNGYPQNAHQTMYNLIEGGAELFGDAQAYPNIGWYSDEVKRFIVESYLGNPANHSIPKNNSDVLEMLSKSEHNDGEAGTIWAYTVGLHLWEYMIANYGINSYWDLVKNVQTENTFDGAIKKTIGIGKSELYANAAPYILKQFKTALATYDK